MIYGQVLEIKEIEDQHRAMTNELVVEKHTVNDKTNRQFCLTSK